MDGRIFISFENNGGNTLPFGDVLEEAVIEAFPRPSEPGHDVTAQSKEAAAADERRQPSEEQHEDMLPPF